MTTHCTKGSGSYELNQEKVTASFDITVDDACTTAKIDNRFITDLNQVINIKLEGENLSLRLASDVGVMHFISVKPN